MTIAFKILHTVLFMNIFHCSKVLTLRPIVNYNIFAKNSLLNCCWTRKGFLNKPSNYTFIMTSVHPNSCHLSKTMTDWSFSPNQLLTLPMDPVKENYVRRNIKDAIFSEVQPTPLNTDLQLVAASEDALINILDMDPKIAETLEFIEFIAGNRVLPSSTPLAHRYGGHQFGVWASQLGDGRAILLGEYINIANKRWELQLKGSGLTPYSRGGDGRAVLRSSIREFLCAEAMHYLGVPTSRVAALVTSNDGVVRDPHYSGHPILERASVVLRLSPTWFRIGSLELLVKQGELNSLRALLKKILETVFPEILDEAANHKLEEAYVLFGAKVAELNYKMWVEWQRVGFTHGVMNSDNISLIGVTIDYGPFGFMSTYDPQYVPNSSDSEARYCYECQIDALTFDLDKLRSVLEVLVKSGELPSSEKAALVQRLTLIFNQARQQAETDLDLVFHAKIGMKKPTSSSSQLISLLLLMMKEEKTDFTMTFRQLGEVNTSELSNAAKLSKYWALKKLSSSKHWEQFVKNYLAALETEGVSEESRKNIMQATNPHYVLRNWMAQKAIEMAEKDDFSEVKLIESVLRTPYTKQEKAEKLGYSSHPPKWESDLKVSCSS